MSDVCREFGIPARLLAAPTVAAPTVAVVLEVFGVLLVVWSLETGLTVFVGWERMGTVPPIIPAGHSGGVTENAFPCVPTLFGSEFFWKLG